MPAEVELKFDLAPGDVELVRNAPALQAAVAESQAYETLYFDTGDRALERAGFSLRVRRSDDRYVQTIKQKNGGSAGLFVRHEWEISVPAFDLQRQELMKGPLKRLLARVPAESLQSLIRTNFVRTRWLVDHRGSRIEVVLDEGRVISGAVEAPICELELELIEGKASGLYRLAKDIGATVPLRLGVLSKAERGNALVDGRLGASAKGEPVRLSPAMTEGEAFQAIANICLRHFRLNEIALLAGKRDPEALHQARVALRRLRSAMTLFGKTLADEEFEHLREELRWFARQFGDARNLDVLIAGLGDKVGPPPELLSMREKAYDRVMTALRARRVQSLFLRMAMWIEGGAWRAGKRASREIGPMAERRLTQQWKKVTRRGADLADLDPKALHQLRVDVKKLRYSAEFLSDLHRDKAVRAGRNRFVSALKTLQERLGDLNDEQVGLELAPWLADLIPAPAKRRSPRATLKAAVQAYERATATAGYWRS
ncbi:MAG: CYTH and CHAD domain-containing protein [Allosphingosinicella sp.]